MNLGLRGVMQPIFGPLESNMGCPNGMGSTDLLDFQEVGVISKKNPLMPVESPPITDTRVIWHVGDVEQELPKLEIVSGPKIVLFDLDIYEPTLFAWKTLSPYLSSGDLLYFDEGFDEDERRVINENVRLDFELTVVGITHTAIAFKLGQRLRNQTGG